MYSPGRYKTQPPRRAIFSVNLKQTLPVGALWTVPTSFKTYWYGGFTLAIKHIKMNRVRDGKSPCDGNKSRIPAVWWVCGTADGIVSRYGIHWRYQLKKNDAAPKRRPQSHTPFAQRAFVLFLFEVDASTSAWTRTAVATAVLHSGCELHVVEGIGLLWLSIGLGLPFSQRNVPGDRAFGCCSIWCYVVHRSECGHLPPMPLCAVTYSLASSTSRATTTVRCEYKQTCVLNVYTIGKVDAVGPAFF